MNNAPSQFTVGDYRRMVAHLRTDLAEQFPDRAIFILDRTQDESQQIAELAVALGTPDLAQRLIESPSAYGMTDKPQDGRGIPVELESPSRRAWFVRGKDDGVSVGAADDEPISTSVYCSMLKSLLHEVGHALQIDDDAVRAWAPSGERRFRESCAELFAIDTLQRAGIAPPGMGDVMAAAYDSDQYGPDTTKQDAIYDIAEGYKRLQQITAPTSYAPEAFKGFPIRDSFARTYNQMQQVRPSLLQSYDNFVVDEVSRQVAGTLLGGGITPSRMDDYEKRHDWLFRGRDEARAGQEYVAAFNAREADYDRQGTPQENRHYAPYQGPDETNTPLEQVVARAWLNQAKTNNELDRWTAQTLLKRLLDRDDIPQLSGKAPVDGFSDAQESAVISHTGETHWAEALLHGASFRDALAEMRTFADRYPADAAFTVPTVAPGNREVDDLFAAPQKGGDSKGR